MLLKVHLLIFLSSEINSYSYYPSRRVQNGDKLDPKVIPKFFVALLREIDHVYHKKFEFHCAGTLISPKNVLTAGYCIRDGTDMVQYIGAFQTEGATDWHEMIRWYPDYFIVHKKYQPTQNEPGYKSNFNIGIVKTTEDIYPMQAPYPTLNLNPLNHMEQVRLYGFGNGNGLHKMEAIVRLDPTPVFCKPFQNDKEFCFHGLTTDTCGFQTPDHSDIGAPLVLVESELDYKLVGVMINSFGAINYGSAVDVNFFNNWITLVREDLQRPIRIADNLVIYCCDEIDDQ